MTVKNKFEQNKPLLLKLLATEDTTLVECNASDKHWSCGLSLYNRQRNDPLKWPGKNYLGDCLVKVRNELKPVG